MRAKKTIIDSLSTVRNLRILIIFLKTPIFTFPQWFNPGYGVKKPDVAVKHEEKLP